MSRVTPYALLFAGIAMLCMQIRIDGLVREVDAMKAGRLDRRILIQRPVPIRNEHGEQLEGWADVATVWAGFERVSGGEDFAAEQRSNRQLVHFNIRYRPDLNARMTIVYDGERYQVEDVGELKDGRRREGLVLVCFVREIESGG